MDKFSPKEIEVRIFTIQNYFTLILTISPIWQNVQNIGNNKSIASYEKFVCDNKINARSDLYVSLVSLALLIYAKGCS